MTHDDEHRLDGNQMDPRIALLNSLADTVPTPYYRDDGEFRYDVYVYAWFHGQTCIYVGEGVNGRYREFFTNQDYNAPEAHAYIKKHHRELEPFFVNSAVTKTAALAIEYNLIGHFKRRNEGGTLFNRARGIWPVCPGSDCEERHHLRRTAESVLIPPGTKVLSKKGHWLATKSLPDFATTAALRLLNDVNPWRPGTPGDAFYKAVLTNKPATVGEALKLAKDAGIGGVQDHLKWLFTWDGLYLEVDGAPWQPSDNEPIIERQDDLCRDPAVST